MTGRIGSLSVNSLPITHPSIEPGRRMSVRSQAQSQDIADEALANSTRPRFSIDDVE